MADFSTYKHSYCHTVGVCSYIIAFFFNLQSHSCNEFLFLSQTSSNHVIFNSYQAYHSGSFIVGQEWSRPKKYPNNWNPNNRGSILYYSAQNDQKFPCIVITT